LLNKVRQVQILTAVHQTAAARPDFYKAHFLLAQLYGQGLPLPTPQGDAVVQYRDLALEHLEKMIESMQAADSLPPGEQEQLAEWEKQRDKFQAEMKTQRNKYELAADKRTFPDKVNLAIQHGLIKEALTLMNANRQEVQDRGPAFITLYVHLLLMTGNLEELRTGLTSELGDQMRGTFHLYKFLWAAAVGDYEEADRSLVELVNNRSSPAPLLP